MHDARRVQWTIFTNATTEKATQKVASRLLKLLDRPAELLEFARYPKNGGWTFSFQTPPSETAHNDSVVEVIALGQRLGYAWTIIGNVFDDLEGWSSEARISGVTNMHWHILSRDHSDTTSPSDT